MLAIGFGAGGFARGVESHPISRVHNAQRTSATVEKVEGREAEREEMV